MLYLILTSIISIIVALLALQNGAPTPLNFIIWQFETPLICVILGSFLAGAVVSGFFMFYTKARHLFVDWRNNKEINRLNKQIESLKDNIALLTEPAKTVNLGHEYVKVEDAVTDSVSTNVPKENAPGGMATSTGENEQ